MHYQNMSLLPKSIVAIGNGKKLVLPAEQANTAKPKCHNVLKIFPSQTAPTSAWGQSLDFKIAPGDVQLIDSMYLQLVLPALTVTGGTYSRFVNDSTWFLNRIEYLSNGSDAPIVVKSSTAGLITYLEDLAFNSPANKTSLWAAIGNNTDALRQTASASAQTLMIPLYSPLTATENGFLNAATSGFTIRVTLSDLSAVVQTDGTVPVCPITSASVLVNGRSIDDPTALNQVMNTAKSSPTNFRYLCPLVQSGIPILAGSSNITIPLTSAVGACAFAFVTVRTSAHVSTALGSIPDAFEVVSTLDCKRASGESMLANQLSGAFCTSILPHTLGIAGDLGDLRTPGPKTMYILPFCEDPQSAWSYGRYTGHADFTGSETLTMNFPAAIPALDVCDVVFYMFHTFEQLTNGSIHRI